MRDQALHVGSPLTGPVILMGPVCVGKTTLLPLVARSLGLRGIDLDDVAEGYYEEVGRGRAALDAVGARLGDPGAYRWWQHGHPHAVRRAIGAYPDAVIALGGGHTVYEDEALFDEIAHALDGLATVLVLPAPDVGLSVEILRARSIAERDFDWLMDGVDLIAAWVTSPQNRALARVTVFTEGRRPDETAAEIVRAVRPDHRADHGAKP